MGKRKLVEAMLKTNTLLEQLVRLLEHVSKPVVRHPPSPDGDAGEEAFKRFLESVQRLNKREEIPHD